MNDRSKESSGQISNDIPSGATTSCWRFLFLQTLRETGNISAAELRADKSRASVYRARERDEEFAAAWDDALEEAADWLELEALRRAIDGIEEGRYFRGEMIGTITKYSDSLLMFLLKARRPQLYGGLRQAPPDDTGSEDALDRLRTELKVKMARLIGEDSGPKTG